MPPPPACGRRAPHRADTPPAYLASLVLFRCPHSEGADQGWMLKDQHVSCTCSSLTGRRQSSCSCPHPGFSFCYELPAAQVSDLSPGSARGATWTGHTFTPVSVRQDMPLCCALSRRRSRSARSLSKGMAKSSRKRRASYSCVHSRSRRLRTGLCLRRPRRGAPWGGGKGFCASPPAAAHTA